jgi:hypothetical protein
MEDGRHFPVGQRLSGEMIVEEGNAHDGMRVHYWHGYPGPEQLKFPLDIRVT